MVPDKDASSVGAQEAKDEAQERCLAGAVVAEQRHALARCDRKREPGQRLDPAEPLAHVRDGEERGHDGTSAASGAGDISGAESTTPPGSNPGNSRCAQRINCTAGLPSNRDAAGWVQSTLSIRSFGR